MIKINGPWFEDEYFRKIFFRGVNLGGSTKVPFTPDGATYRLEDFFNHKQVSFIGRPFPLEQADEHFSRLKAWGCNFLRFLITWEAIEHSGPGIYDEDYLNYLYKILKKAADYDLNILLDPHQDVWSRFSGGDGAPGWTFDLIGMDITKFKESGAAIVHATHGDPFPRMIWPTNANKLASATLFTLFFGGRDFAPKTCIEDRNIQDFLQEHYINAIKKAAERVKDLPNIVGINTMNEPSCGFIGIPSLQEWSNTLQFGESPTPIQSILAGAGYPQSVHIKERGILSQRSVDQKVINPGGVSVWKEGYHCIWQQNGVWQSEGEKEAFILREDYFCEVNGKEIDFSKDYYLPFARRFAAEMHKVRSDYKIFIETEPMQPPAEWPDAAADQIVYCPHWYDGYVLYFKSFNPLIGANAFTQKAVFGRKNIEKSFSLQLGQFRKHAEELLDNIPVVIGEIGIPFDLDEKKSFSTGNFKKQIKALDRSMKALEANLFSYTIWNYTADNSNERGDKWNDEDFSLFSPDQQTDPTDIHSGGRALKAFLRPFPLITSGTPLKLHFDLRTRTFEYSFIANSKIKQVSEIYVPEFQYPYGYIVDLSAGSYEKVQEDQKLLIYNPSEDQECVLYITPKPRPRSSKNSKNDTIKTD